MSQVGEAFVVVKPVVTDFRAAVARGVDARLGQAPIPIPVQPTIAAPGAAGAAAITWQKLAGGAVIPVPIQPTITPEAQRQFGGSLGGLRGLLLGTGAGTAARAAGISGLAAGVFVLGKASLSAVKSAATLEQELDVLQQVSGATDDQMAQLAATARALGADVRLPGVSSADAAATMVELAKAGLTVDDVLKGTRGTLELATAANIDFATSSELAADALNAFQLPGSEATKVADLLAGAANAAQGDISDFGVALAQSAAVAHQAGIPLSETVTFLTELAKAGLSGSDAGTSLRTTLLRLIAPTNEARKIFNLLGIEITDAQGNVRTDVFEQLRASLDRLEPATRNTALATIFGSDAVRAAAIFVRDGARGHEDLARQVERSGQAQETAAARTKGLAGATQGLGSNMETLGTDLGTIVVPALTEFVDGASEAVGVVDSLVVNAEKLANVDLGPFGKIGDAIKKGAGDALEAIPGVGALKVAYDALQHSADDARRTITGFPGAGDRSSPQFDAAQRGRDTGNAFSQGVAKGIAEKEPEAVRAARRTVADAQANLRQVVADGQKAVQQIIEQGQQAIEQSAVEAKQNLASITSTLGQQVVQILDSGPLAQRIDQLQARLDRSRASLERSRLRGDLRDARAELERAQAAIAGGGGSPEQRRAEADFLRPFQERVKDAQAALEEFNTQGNVEKLTERLQAQKDRIQRLLNDIVARFNAGLLSGPEANAAVAGVLARSVGPINRAGKTQGFAFRQGFIAEVEGLQAQVAAIIAGPQTKKSGAEARVVSPAQVAAQAAADARDAREQATRQQVSATKEVTDAVRSLHTAEDKATSTTNGLLAQIRDQLAGKPAGSKPSSSVKSEPSRPIRTGGR